MQPCLSNKESLVALPLEDPSLKQEKWWYKPQMLCSYYHSEFSLSQFWMDLTFPWFTEDIKINKENKRIKRKKDAHTLEPEIQNLSKNENPRERGMSEKERSNTWKGCSSSTSARVAGVAVAHGGEDRSPMRGGDGRRESLVGVRRVAISWERVVNSRLRIIMAFWFLLAFVFQMIKVFVIFI